MPYKDNSDRRTHREINKEKINKYNRMQYWKNIDKMRERDRARYPKRKKECEAYSLKKHYNITVEQKEHMRISQNNKCAICGSDFKNNKDINVDHIHGVMPMRIRELLCGKCNKGIGLLNDNSDLLRKAAIYIDKWRVTI